MKRKKIDMALVVGAQKLHSGRKFMYNEIDKTHKKYFGKDGFYKKQFLHKRNCPLCHSKQKNILFKKRGGLYNKCINCNLVYLSPVFKDVELSKYYQNLHDAQSKVTKNESYFYRNIYTEGLRAIEKFKKKGELLDIGCSSGFFLDIAKERGWNTFGIEPGKKEAKLAKKNHIIFDQDIKNLNKNIKFDVITMWDVIEHIKDGNKALQDMRKKLNKNGLIFFQTPNIYSLAARIMQEKCNVFDGIEHVNLYDKDTMEILAKRNKFKIVYYKTVISEIPVTANYLDYQNPYFGNNKNNKKIFNIIDEKTLHNNFLGYKMQTVLKKL